MTRWWRARYGTCSFHRREWTIAHAGSRSTGGAPSPGDSKAMGTRSRSSIAPMAPILRARLEDDVERRLGRAPDAREARRLEHAAQPRLARLGAERQTALLGERAR